MNSYTDYFGIDISKQTFYVVKKDREYFQYERKKNYYSLKKTIIPDSIWIMKATGIYF